MVALMKSTDWEAGLNSWTFWLLRETMPNGKQPVMVGHGSVLMALQLAIAVWAGFHPVTLGQDRNYCLSILGESRPSSSDYDACQLMSG